MALRVGIPVGLVAIALAPAIAHAEEPPLPVASTPELVVEVSGDPLLPRARRDPTAASSVLDAETLTQPGLSAADGLARAPGVQVARRGSGSDLATAALRGTSSAQTPVYLSGVRINDDITGTADLSSVPTWMLERAEIYRSFVPTDADRSSIGGAVFFEPTLPRQTRVGGGGTVGSFGYLSTQIGAQLATPKAGALISVSRESATNDFPFVDDGGTAFDQTDDVERRRPNADHEQYAGWAIGQARLGEGVRVTSLAHVFGREQGVTGLGTLPAQSARTTITRGLGAVRASLPCGSNETGQACHVELGASALVGGRFVDDPDRELNLGTEAQDTRGARVALSSTLRLPFGDAVALHAAIHPAFERLRIQPRDRATVRAQRRSARGVAQLLIKPAARLTTLTEVAVETHGTSTSAPVEAPNVLQPTARLGAAWDHDAVRLFGNIGRAVRVPTLGDLYGVGAAARGNAQLRAETAWTAEAGAGLRFGTDVARVEAELVPFVRWSEDLIALRRSSAGAVTPYNVSAARALGLETLIAVDLVKHIRVDGHLTLLDPRDTSDEQSGADLLPYTARLIAAPELTLYSEPFLNDSVDRAAISTSLLYRSSRVADPAGLVVLDELATVDVEATLVAFDERLISRTRLSNINDQRTSDLLGFPLPGRAVYASLETWW